MNFKTLAFAFAALITFSGVHAQNASYDIEPKIKSRPIFNAKIPATLNESGYCCMKMDIDTSGKAKNIDAQFCTNDDLIVPYKIHMSKFKFSPALKNGKPVLKQNFIYRLGRVTRDKNGNILPGPDGYLTRRFPKRALPPGPKRVANSKWLRKHFRTGKPCGYYVS